MSASECLRHTPAGVPVLSFRLVHTAPVREAGRDRMASCEIDALAFGDIAARLASTPADCFLRLTGFLDRKGARNPMPNLHVTEFEIIKE